MEHTESTNATTLIALILMAEIKDIEWLDVVDAERTNFFLNG